MSAVLGAIPCWVMSKILEWKTIENISILFLGKKTLYSD